MPLYEYVCKKCGARFEEMTTFAKADEMTCIECGSKKVERLASTFACSTDGGDLDQLPSCGTGG